MLLSLIADVSVYSTSFDNIGLAKALAIDWSEHGRQINYSKTNLHRYYHGASNQDSIIIIINC